MPRGPRGEKRPADVTGKTMDWPNIVRMIDNRELRGRIDMAERSK